MKHLKQTRVSSKTQTRPNRFTLRLYYQLADETVLFAFGNRPKHIKAEEINYNNVIFTFSNSVTKQMVYLQIHVNLSWL